MKWIIYILECSDNSLYTGITNDLERRLEEHRAGRGAKYTKHRSPLRLRYTEYRSTNSAAFTRDAAIKALIRSKKLALIAAHPTTKRSASALHLSDATNESDESSEQDLRNRSQDLLKHGTQITERARAVPDIGRTVHRRKRLRLQSSQSMDGRLRECRVRHIVGQRPLLIFHEHLPAPVQYV
jgi:putative endonuclease